MNIVAVKTLTLITPQLGFDYVKNFGFTTVVDREEVTVGGETQIFSDIQQSLGLGGLTRGVTNEMLPTLLLLTREPILSPSFIPKWLTMTEM